MRAVRIYRNVTRAIVTIMFAVFITGTIHADDTSVVHEKKICANIDVLSGEDLQDDNPYDIDLAPYIDAANGMETIVICETDDLTGEMLENRNGIIYIEVLWGIVLNDDGDGRVLSTSDPFYNYISYKYVDGATTGNIILTYLIYNPETNYVDDVIARVDYIIGEKEGF